MDIFLYNIAKYPKELQEWVSNKENLAIAGTVSSYAASAPGEFIAETFAKLISGHPLTDDVMNLYKQLGGILP